MTELCPNTARADRDTGGSGYAEPGRISLQGPQVVYPRTLTESCSWRTPFPAWLSRAKKAFVPELTAFCHFPHLILLDLAEALKAGLLTQQPTSGLALSPATWAFTPPAMHLLFRRKRYQRSFGSSHSHPLPPSHSHPAPCRAFYGPLSTIHFKNLDLVLHVPLNWLGQQKRPNAHAFLVFIQKNIRSIRIFLKMVFCTHQPWVVFSFVLRETSTTWAQLSFPIMVFHVKCFWLLLVLGHSTTKYCFSTCHTESFLRAAGAGWGPNNQGTVSMSSSPHNAESDESDPGAPFHFQAFSSDFFLFGGKRLAGVLMWLAEASAPAQNQASTCLWRKAKRLQK